MIVSTTIDATAPTFQSLLHSWKAISWAQAIECVRKLQIRIAKAWKEGNLRKVKNLQRLLLHSFYAKLLAIKRVTSNKGSKTPGIDKVIWKTPQAKMRAAIQLGKAPYKPLPLRRIYILKTNGKKRPLGLPAMFDRAMQALHLLTLEPIAETTADRNSYGFRPCRSTADAIAQCFIVLAKKTSAQYVLEGDIKACFDEISHAWMLENIPMDKTTLKKQLKAGYMENNAFHDTESGTVQGGLNSPTLANMALDGVENLLQKHFGRKIKTHLIHFIRYADDFIITARSKETLENEVKPLLAAFFKTRGLRLSEEKTIITHIQEGFNFLGQTIRKFKDKLIIKPSDKSIKSVLEKVKTICNENKQATDELIIKQLNPIIRGWANYHRHVVSSFTFGKVDSKIFEILWRWAKRRHPNKGRRWVKDKYFKPAKNRNWVFSNDSATLHLFSASQIKIKRHIKIKQDANPFDPEWEHYFEKRERDKLLERWNGKNQALYIRQKQDNLCVLCGDKFSQQDKWEYHFKQPWTQGGSTQNYNLVMVHPSCHECLHAKNEYQAGSLSGLTEGLEPYDGKLSRTVLRGR